MEYEEIMRLGQETSDKDYAKFLSNNGWEYENEQDAHAGYGRMVKSMEGTPLTLEEFLAELQAEGDTLSQQQLYGALLEHMKKGALSAQDIYLYAKYRWCVKAPEAVIAYKIGKKQWAVNTCSEKITEDQAKVLINTNFGFEVSRIKLLDVPYYDATDWNFISFRCGPYDWLMWNGDLYKIYQ